MESKSMDTSAKVPQTIESERTYRRTYRGANMLRFFLMPFVCFASFGFLGASGSLFSRLSLFAPIAFYILCGFMLAAKEIRHPDIYKRLMMRSAGQFALIFMIYIIMNGVLMALTGTFAETVSQLLRKRVLFNIIVMCTWPFPAGETIWFIQSLFYARVILFFMHKYNLLRHYKKVLIVTALLTVLFGEFAGIIHFNFHGYTYIPGNAITRALPYMLFGRLLYEKEDVLFTRPSRVYFLAFFAGIFATIAEIFILSRTGRLIYTGHMIGYGIMAFSACCLFLKMNNLHRDNFFVEHGRSYSWRIYVLSQPIGHLLMILAGLLTPGFYILMNVMGGLIVYLVCLAVAVVLGDG